MTAIALPPSPLSCILFTSSILRLYSDDRPSPFSDDGASGLTILSPRYDRFFASDSDDAPLQGDASASRFLRSNTNGAA